MDRRLGDRHARSSSSQARYRAADRALRRLCGDLRRQPGRRRGASSWPAPPRRAARPRAVRCTPATPTSPGPTSRTCSCSTRVTLLREFRGDGHIAALVVEGVTGLEAAVLHVAQGDSWTREPLRKTRGYSTEEWDAAVAGLRERGWLDEARGFTDEGRARPPARRGPHRRAGPAARGSSSARTAAPGCASWSARCPRPSSTAAASGSASPQARAPVPPSARPCRRACSPPAPGAPRRPGPAAAPGRRPAAPRRPRRPATRARRTPATIAAFCSTGRARRRWRARRPLGEQRAEVELGLHPALQPDDDQPAVRRASTCTLRAR